ncbi:MAG TPA: methylated-DNA--[protein]-cysteine S-methyltransferase [Firmicutes bacterium]|nr:methylated-DNA--[protein]-cysteine S-methyltransferase [Bacillota bacterium]
MKRRKTIKSPIGPLTLVEEGGALVQVVFDGDPVIAGREEDSPLLREAERQLAAYFAGHLQVFSLPLRTEGTPFQEKVWRALQQIPYGETRTYGELAASIGQPAAARAVGGANHRNPLPIVIPCHRVVAAHGGLGGYGGGLDKKRWLLALEAK